MNIIKTCKCGCGQVLTNIKNSYIVGHSNRSSEVKFKKQQSFLNKYGVDNPSKLIQIKEKKVATFLKHFGVTHFMKSEEGRKNLESTNIEKYGTKNVFSNFEIINKIKKIRKLKQKEITNKTVQTKRNLYYEKLFNGLRLQDKFIPLFTKDEYIGVGIKKYKFQCKKCNNITESTLDDGCLPRCYTCNPLITSGGQSIAEYELIKFLKSIYNKESLKIQNRSEIFPLELDVYISDKQLAIEFDGLYWHSEAAGLKKRNYHLIKTQECNKKNIRLIHIFEDEWSLKPKIVKARLKYILGKIKYRIYGRECEIKSIDATLKNKFLNKYHIQGEDRSAINLGLFYKNRLVSLMTFSKLRKALGQKAVIDYWELSRFCSISHFNVLGAANKLFKYFEDNYKPKQVISYSDIRWNTGHLYLKLGFKLDHISTPNYWYIDKTYQKRYHRFGFRKNILHERLKEFNSTLSEWQNMQNNGYDRIWDCGNLVFIKNYLDLS